MRPAIHRNYIPRHKKGGSVSAYTLVEQAPAIRALYQAPAFIDFLASVTGRRLLPCPATRSPRVRALLLHGAGRSHRLSLRHVLLPGRALHRAGGAHRALVEPAGVPALPGRPRARARRARPQDRSGHARALQRRQALARHHAPRRRRGAGEPHPRVRHRPLDVPAPARRLEHEGRHRLLRPAHRLPGSAPRRGSPGP